MTRSASLQQHLFHNFSPKESLDQLLFSAHTYYSLHFGIYFSRHDPKLRNSDPDQHSDWGFRGPGSALLNLNNSVCLCTLAWSTHKNHFRPGLQRLCVNS